MRVRVLLGCLVLLLLACGCNPEVDVYAPERELYAVYGVLNPDSAAQYVTVTKVYQYEGDAYAYAAANDLTARGLLVTLRSDSMAWNSTLVDIPDSNPVVFSPSTGAYRFETAGAQALRQGQRYDLEIRKPEDPDFLITAHTTIPTRPRLTSPGPPIYFAEVGEYTFPTIEFSEEQTVGFEKGTGFGFEVRVMVEYWADGARKVGRWGPSPVFQEPVGCGASVNSEDGCYTIPRASVPNAWRTLFATYTDTVWVYDTLRVAQSLDSLSRIAWVEVTGIDSALTTYLVANSSFGFGLNLLMDKAEYSNISGDNVGVFGSILMHGHFCYFGGCTRWLSGLRGARPFGCGN